jgi:hypothetical protein
MAVCRVRLVVSRLHHSGSECASENLLGRRSVPLQLAVVCATAAGGGLCHCSWRRSVPLQLAAVCATTAGGGLCHYSWRWSTGALLSTGLLAAAGLGAGMATM